MLRNMTAVYITDRDRMLLLYRVGSRVVPPSWCGIGGHFEPEEWNDPRRCVLRELYEETGIKENDIANLRLKYITFRLKNNEIRQNYYFFAEWSRRELALKPCGEGTLEWVEIRNLAGLEMPHGAKHCLEHYLRTGIRDDDVYCGSAVADGVVWTALKEF